MAEEAQSLVSPASLESLGTRYLEPEHRGRFDVLQDVQE